MELQEIYDNVKSHLLAQGCRASKDGICRYRTPEGLKCAAGCLIPDSLYRESMEGYGIGVLLFPENDYCPGDYVKWDKIALREALGISLSDSKEMSLLRLLQKVHDNEKPEYWAEELAGVAKRFGLNP
jgi:hypothetical protein